MVGNAENCCKGSCRGQGVRATLVRRCRGCINEGTAPCDRLQAVLQVACNAYLPSNPPERATSSNAYLTVNPSGVSLALYSGITIDGVVGLTYGIQCSTNLSNTNCWRGMVNVTLSTPTELWFDVQPANQARRFYRVVPGPISIP